MAPAPLNIACFRFPTGDDAMQGVLRAAGASLVCPALEAASL
jgi:hypothetical protein